jgi:hypothetical protein
MEMTAVQIKFNIVLPVSSLMLQFSDLKCYNLKAILASIHANNQKQKQYSKNLNGTYKNCYILLCFFTVSAFFTINHRICGISVN